MIILDENLSETSKGDLQADIRSTVPPSEELPSFEESTSHVQLDLFQSDYSNGHVASDPPYQDPPPTFSPYVASYFTHRDGSIVSHDPHLNEDGEALYRFLLSQSSTSPPYHLLIRGTHAEQKVRLVSSNRSHDRHHHRRDQGHGQIETEAYTELIIDFDFTIDLNPNILTLPQHAPIQWSVCDGEPAYRGKMYQQTEMPSNFGQRTMFKVTKKRLKEYKAYCRERDATGLPPWAYNPTSPHSDHQLHSSRTVRQWCDDYCSSNRHLKEFVYTKVVYGWNFEQLTSAIRTLIVDQSGYMGDLQIEFTAHPKASNLIIVRPTNILSRALSNTWIKFLLIITLVYPFIWLYKRFHHRGGGIWKVCGGGYPLKVARTVQRKAEPLIDLGPSGSIPQTNITYTEELTGEREGVWFKRWETTIRHSVARKRRESVAFVRPDDHVPPNVSAVQLDGYEES